MQSFSAWGVFLIVNIIGFVVKNDAEYHRFPKKVQYSFINHQPNIYRKIEVNMTKSLAFCE
jgi:hypothetical protein